MYVRVAIEHGTAIGNFVVTAYVSQSPPKADLLSSFRDRAGEYAFLLDGKEPLAAIHDEQGDVLYVWRGERARPAICVESRESHLARIDPGTGELVGFTIFGWDGQLREQSEITVTVAAIRRDTVTREQHEHTLELMPS